MYDSQMAHDESSDTDARNSDLIQYEPVALKAACCFDATVKQSEEAAYIEKGLALIRQGKVAVVLNATQLVSEDLEADSSKRPSSHGLLNIGLPSGKCVFQLLVENFLRVQ